MIRGQRGFGADAKVSRLRAAIVVCIAVLAAAVLIAPSSQAASLTWDSGGASAANPTDGAGAWDTTTAWWSNGGSDAAWNNANNDIAVFGNNNGAAGTVTLGAAIAAGGLTFNAPGSGTYTIGSGTLTLAGSSPTIAANTNATIASSILCTNGFTKMGAGTLTLGTGNFSVTNALTGTVSVAQGTIAYSAAANLPKTTGKISLDGTTLQFIGTNAYQVIQGGLILTANGGTLDDSSTVNAYTAINPGNVTCLGSGPRTLRLTGTGIKNSSFNGTLTNGTGGATSLTKDGTGVWCLGVANKYTGDTTINAGNLYLTASGVVTNPIPTNSTVYIAKAGTLNVGQPQTIGNLQDGAGGGGTIAQAWSALITLTVQSGSFSGAIKDSPATPRVVALTKSTGGTLTLSGTNTYNGPTLVNGGALLINRVSTNSAVTVSGGATLGGSGKIYGPTGTVYAVTTAATNSYISPGTNSPGTLTLRSLDATSGADFVFELGTSKDLLTVIGALTGSSAANGLVFDFANAGGLAAKTPYTLINFGSATGLDYTDLLANTLPSGFVMDASFGGGNGFQINANSLQVQFALPRQGSVVVVH